MPCNFTGGYLNYIVPPIGLSEQHLKIVVSEELVSWDLPPSSLLDACDKNTVPHNKTYSPPSRGFDVHKSSRRKLYSKTTNPLRVESLAERSPSNLHVLLMFVKHPITHQISVYGFWPNEKNSPTGLEIRF